MHISAVCTLHSAAQIPKMAEFPDLGNHCEAKNCHILDFLPFTCVGCNKIFCSDHRQPYAHSCPTVDNEIENAALVTYHTSVKCSLEECSCRELLPVLCDLCALCFCIRHRHPQDHRCSNLPSGEPAESKTATLVKFILETKREVPKKEKALSKKAAKTAAQVNLMKIKLNAKGDASIPPCDRVHFLITLPNRDVKIGYYFSKVWTIGKIIDYTAFSEDIPNLNNVADAKKLKVFKFGSADALPTAETLEHLIVKEDIFNGESLQFLYF